MILGEKAYQNKMILKRCLQALPTRRGARDAVLTFSNPVASVISMASRTVSQSRVSVRAATGRSWPGSRLACRTAASTRPHQMISDRAGRCPRPVSEFRCDRLHPGFLSPATPESTRSCSTRVRSGCCSPWKSGSQPNWKPSAESSHRHCRRQAFRRWRVPSQSSRISGSISGGLCLPIE
jgi:hypothetical protein